MQSNGGLGRRPFLPRQGQHPVRPGRRRRRRRAYRRPRRLRQDHQLRHGRHLDRRGPLRRRIRAFVRDAGGRGAHARADDAHSHRGGRRRLDPALRRRALPRRTGFGGRRSGPGLLSPRWAAVRDRRQPHGRQNSAPFLPQYVRRGWRRIPRRRGGAREVQRACRRDRGGDRRPAHRGRNRWPRVSSRSRSKTWPTRSSRSRSNAATT